MVEALAKNWPAIAEKVHKEKRPFAYTFGLRGKLVKL
jgi:hypothetical protein